MQNRCKDCLYKIVKRDGWCYMFRERPTPCSYFIAWAALRDFIGKLLIEAMSL
jgi:hypothetical protein